MFANSKKLIVRGLKNHTTMRTAAIGDGGNDVGMIQELISLLWNLKL